jgi:hypothetical protein
MAVAHRDYGMTTVEVEVFSALLVPNVATFATHNVDVEKRIYGIECHCFEMVKGRFVCLV